MDALLAIGGCDKNMPGAMLAMARMNIPAIFVYGGTIKPGKLGACDLTVVSAFEAVGQYSGGRIDEQELTAIEKNACPGAGSCGGMFTANTMSAAFEVLGLSLPYSSTMAPQCRSAGHRHRGQHPPPGPAHPQCLRKRHQRDHGGGWLHQLRAAPAGGGPHRWRGTQH
jgi:dihydroxyacid dehydratase/phosphogluconate dehydratase